METWHFSRRHGGFFCVFEAHDFHHLFLFSLLSPLLHLHSSPLSSLLSPSLSSLLSPLSSLLLSSLSAISSHKELVSGDEGTRGTNLSLKPCCTKHTKKETVDRWINYTLQRMEMNGQVLVWMSDCSYGLGKLLRIMCMGRCNDASAKHFQSLVHWRSEKSCKASV